MRVAETSVQENVGALWSKVLELIGEGGVTRPNPGMTDRYLRQFQTGIPANDPASLGDIINAGWARYKQLTEAKSSEAELSELMDGLNEMILKTVEVLEFRHRVS